MPVDSVFLLVGHSPVLRSREEVFRVDHSHRVDGCSVMPVEKWGQVIGYMYTVHCYKCKVVKQGVV